MSYGNTNFLTQALLLSESMEDDAEEEEEEEEELEVSLGAFVVAGALEMRRQRSAARQRLYLRRAELLPDPRGVTPWQCLLASMNDRAFITTMGIDVHTFNLILERGFTFLWNSRPIPRPDVSPTATPRLHRRSLDSAGALGLVLHWLNSTMRETSLQQIFALVPATTSRYVHAAVDVLLAVLEDMPEASLAWPTGDEFQTYSAVVQHQHNLLEGAFGVVDGLNLPVQTSEDEDIENATYNGWLHGHFVSNVLAFAPTGMSKQPHCLLMN